MVALPNEVFARIIAQNTLDQQMIDEQQEFTPLKETWKGKYNLQQDEEGAWVKGSALVVVHPEGSKQHLLE